ncbi:hypothetical protein K8R62_01235, partial [bacterium]|nr:hypothetical protein [bacterium]
DIFGYPIYRGYIFDTVEEDKGQYDDDKEIFWGCGVALLIKRSIFDEIGFLDKDFCAYAEEIDLCWRINLKGYKIMFAHKPKLYHVGSGSWSKKPFKSKYLLHRNHILILFKNYSFKNLMWIIPIKFSLEIISMFNFLFKKNWNESAAVVLSLAWILTHPIFIYQKHKKTQEIRNIGDKNIMKKMLKTSVAIQYFLHKKKRFKDYIRYI